MSHPSLALHSPLVPVSHVLGLHPHLPDKLGVWIGGQEDIGSLAFVSILSFSSLVQQWARITMMSQVRENASPSLRNSSLNLTGFSQNLENLSLQMNPVKFKISLWDVLGAT